METTDICWWIGIGFWAVGFSLNFFNDKWKFPWSPFAYLLGLAGYAAAIATAEPRVHQGESIAMLTMILVLAIWITWITLGRLVAQAKIIEEERKRNAE